MPHRFTCRETGPNLEIQTHEISQGPCTAVVDSLGATVLDFAVNDIPVLAPPFELLDEDSGRTGKLRGGIPLLFPIAGPDVGQLGLNLSERIPQHGDLRNQPFEFLSADPYPYKHGLTLRHVSRGETPFYPYSYIAIVSVYVVDDMSRVFVCRINFTIWKASCMLACYCENKPHRK